MIATVRVIVLWERVKSWMDNTGSSSKRAGDRGDEGTDILKGTNWKSKGNRNSHSNQFQNQSWLRSVTCLLLGGSTFKLFITDLHLGDAKAPDYIRSSRTTKLDFNNYKWSNNVMVLVRIFNAI